MVRTLTGCFNGDDQAPNFAAFIPLAQTKLGLLPLAELRWEQVTKLLADIAEKPV